MDDEESEEGRVTGSQAAGGLLAGQEEAMKQVGEHMLSGAKLITRFVLKRIPGGPALVFDAAEYHRASNKARAAFGIAGGVIGGAGGGAFGGLAGGVNAPIGAAVGSTLGENLGEPIYDEHAQAIDPALDVAGRGMHNLWRHISPG